MQMSVEALHRGITDVESKLINLTTDPGSLQQKTTYTRVNSTLKIKTLQPSRDNLAKQRHNIQPSLNARLQKEMRYSRLRVLGIQRIWGAARSCTVSAAVSSIL